ncbi:MAG: tRNA adenosine(34) deaminase TadA [Synergistaceae bacterium]|jgi:tRNA(adenine34) deaminase|nr:tRNA adenosine(34) deaminase TadA [Synergistaceae bacterium]
MGRAGIDDAKFMMMALDEARAALSRGEIPVGAVVVLDGAVIGRGGNGRAVCSLPFAHAEMSALEEAGRSIGAWRFDNCTLYVTLEPCPMCAGAIVQTRVRRVVYGASDPKAGAAGTLYDIPRDPRMPHRCEVRSGLMALESTELLRKFFSERRRKR